VAIERGAMAGGEQQHTARLSTNKESKSKITLAHISFFPFPHSTANHSIRIPSLRLFEQLYIARGAKYAPREM
jgi:hypothetical protein